MGAMMQGEAWQEEEHAEGRKRKIKRKKKYVAYMSVCMSAYVCMCSFYEVRSEL